MNGILKAESQSVLSTKRVKINDKRDSALKYRKTAWKSLFSIFGMDEKSTADSEID